uniref:PH domain-containing protein n=1 Tax=Parastrongyloides trichosuri TaxID=131310 RepID=A0A0N4ZPP4_PARTI
MGSGVSKKDKYVKKDIEVKNDENVNKQHNLNMEIVDVIRPWTNISYGANIVVKDIQVNHLYRTLELNEKSYQSWVNAISDSEDEIRTFTKNKRPKKKIVRKKKVAPKRSPSIEPSKNIFDNTSNYNNKRNYYKDKPPFTFKRFPTPPPKFLASKNYEHL